MRRPSPFVTARLWDVLQLLPLVHLTNGQRRHAEVHWYEAHGIGGKEEMKRKRYVNDDHARN